MCLQLFFYVILAFGTNYKFFGDHYLSACTLTPVVRPVVPALEVSPFLSLSLSSFPHAQSTSHFGHSACRFFTKNLHRGVCFSQSVLAAPKVSAESLGLIDDDTGNLFGDNKAKKKGGLFDD